MEDENLDASHAFNLNDFLNDSMSLMKTKVKIEPTRGVIKTGLTPQSSNAAYA